MGIVAGCVAGRWEGKSEVQAGELARGRGKLGKSMVTLREGQEGERQILGSFFFLRQRDELAVGSR